MVYLKSLIISKSKPLYERGFNEKDVPTQQSQTEEDTWVFGKDEYQERSKGFKTEENERAKKVDRLSEGAL
jgi:hypothetical protein